jgi:hypothetical protein
MAGDLRADVVHSVGRYVVVGALAARAGEFMVIAALDAELRWVAGAWCAVPARPAASLSLPAGSAESKPSPYSARGSCSRAWIVPRPAFSPPMDHSDRMLWPPATQRKR